MKLTGECPFKFTNVKRGLNFESKSHAPRIYISIYFKNNVAILFAYHAMMAPLSNSAWKRQAQLEISVRAVVILTRRTSGG